MSASDHLSPDEFGGKFSFKDPDGIYAKSPFAYQTRPDDARATDTDGFHPADPTDADDRARSYNFHARRGTTDYTPLGPRDPMRRSSPTPMARRDLGSNEVRKEQAVTSLKNSIPLRAHFYGSN